MCVYVHVFVHSIFYLHKREGWWFGVRDMWTVYTMRWRGGKKGTELEECERSECLVENFHAFIPVCIYVYVCVNINIYVCIYI